MSLEAIFTAGKRLHKGIIGQIEQKVVGIKIPGTGSLPPGDIDDLYWRNRHPTSLNANNILQPDLVPSEPDKAPHLIMAPEQIWR